MPRLGARRHPAGKERRATRLGQNQTKSEHKDTTQCIFGSVSICVFGFRLVITCRSSCPEEVETGWGSVGKLMLSLVPLDKLLGIDNVNAVIIVVLLCWGRSRSRFTIYERRSSQMYRGRSRSRRRELNSPSPRPPPQTDERGRHHIKTQNIKENNMINLLSQIRTFKSSNHSTIQSTIRDKQ